MTVALFFTHVHAIAVAVLSACQRTAEIAIITGTLTIAVALLQPRRRNGVRLQRKIRLTLACIGSSIALIGLLDVDTLYMLTNEGITLGTMALEALTAANAFVLWRSSHIV